MFANKKNERQQEQKGNSFNLIAGGTEITGDINTMGDIRIDGQLTGDITCKSKLVIGEGGVVIGNINCQTGEISGTIDGRIVVTELLQLNKTAIIKGNIESTRFVVEDGASIIGNCQTNKTLLEANATQPIKLIEYDQPKKVLTE